MFLHCPCLRVRYPICDGRLAAFAHDPGARTRPYRKPYPVKLLKCLALPLPCLVAVAVLTEPTQAQTIPSNYERIEYPQEGGAFVGAFSGGTGRFGFGPKSGVLLGGRYAIELGGPFSFEGVAAYLAGSRDVIDPELAEGNRVAGEADLQMLLAEARFKFALTGRRTWHGISPHLLFGGGVAYEFAGAQPADERILESDRFTFGTNFMASGGGGFRWFLTDKWTVRTDGVVRIWKIQTPPGYAEVNRGFDSVEESEWTNNLSLSIGLAYRF